MTDADSNPPKKNTRKSKSVADKPKNAKEKHGFPRYFAPDEAARCLEQAIQFLTEARAEVNEARSQIILMKRMFSMREEMGEQLSDEEKEALKRKYHEFQLLGKTWMDTFVKEGFLLKDIDHGLIDFPYYSQTRDDVYLLCWKEGDDGLFYFHELTTGFNGRKPLALLPE